ncbi:hypothetical protein FO519_002792 [Halicephalobus sp. NKZ332]|nr:hypothetical protein FO519_002792 [Halicephalobus sp. NKZ332]
MRILGPPIFLLFIFFHYSLTEELSENEVTLAPPLPVCESFQACSAEVSAYPVIITAESIIGFETDENIPSSTPGSFAEFAAGEEDLTVIHSTIPDFDVEGSGVVEGSGQDPSPMLQFIVTSTPESGSTAFPLYDEFVNSPSLFDFKAQPNTTQKRLCRCGSNDDKEDKCSFSDSTTLVIDGTLKLAFCSSPKQHSRCIGRRNLVRIIGEIHESGEAIKNVLDTAIFCDCPNGFRRVGIEPWEGGYAFEYQCK